MITIKPTIIPGNRRKDGTYAVIMRVTFKGKCRRIMTTMIARPEQLTRSLKLKDGALIAQADKLKNQMLQVAAQLSPFDLQDRDIDWVVAQLKTRLSTQTFRLDFFAYADKFTANMKDGTRRTYTSAINAFARYLGKRTLDINEIKKRMVLEFADFLNKEKRIVVNRYTGQVYESKKERKKDVTSVMYVTKLARIYNSARNKYNDDEAEQLAIPGTPFSGLGLRQANSEGQESLGHELMQRIINEQFDGRYCKARRRVFDVLIMSFGLMGANLVDLYNAPKPSADVWSYDRQKTRDRRRDKAHMNVNIPPQLKPFVSRLEGRGNYWLNDLRNAYTRQDGATGTINQAIKRWCEREGIKPFTFYAIRHTWADIARNECKVPKWLVDECLAHIGDFDLTDIYASRNWQEINEANAKVLAVFDWPSEKTDF